MIIIYQNAIAISSLFPWHFNLIESCLLYVVILSKWSYWEVITTLFNSFLLCQSQSSYFKSWSEINKIRWRTHLKSYFSFSSRCWEFVGDLVAVVLERNKFCSTFFDKKLLRCSSSSSSISNIVFISVSICNFFFFVFSILVFWETARPRPPVEARRQSDRRSRALSWIGSSLMHFSSNGIASEHNWRSLEHF